MREAYKGTSSIETVATLQIMVWFAMPPCIVCALSNTILRQQSPIIHHSSFFLPIPIILLMIGAINAGG